MLGSGGAITGNVPDSGLGIVAGTLAGATASAGGIVVVAAADALGSGISTAVAGGNGTGACNGNTISAETDPVTRVNTTAASRCRFALITA
jgi:hypothetical protein